MHTFVASEQYMKGVVGAVLVVDLMLFVADGLTVLISLPNF